MIVALGSVHVLGRLSLSLWIFLTYVFAQRGFFFLSSLLFLVQYADDYMLMVFLTEVFLSHEVWTHTLFVVCHYCFFAGHREFTFWT